MKNFAQKAGSLLLAFALAAAPSAFAAEPTGSEIYTATGYQFAYSESGVVHLYDESGETILTTIDNGAKVTVTNGQKDGLTYVLFGSSAGWIRNGELYQQLPQSYTGEVSGSSAPANQLIPVQTAAPQLGSQQATPSDTDNDEDEISDEITASDTATEAGSEADTPEADETHEADETISDEKDHDPIAAMYEPEDSDAAPEAVDVVQLGAVFSVIIMDDERQQVETRLLTFGEEVHADQKIGYVHAPRTGQAGLRAEPSKEGKVITQLKAGQLAAVLSIDEDYAHVSVQGQEGWLRLDCLKYLTATDDGIVSSALQEKKAAEAASSADQQDEQKEADGGTGDVVITDDNGDTLTPVISYPASALLSLKGETDGSTSVNLRNLPTKDASKTAVLRTGVSVTVLSRTEGWYLVETDGVCGFVMEAFLTLDE